MTQKCKLTESAKEYLSCFYNILNNMIEGMDTACLNNSISHNFIVQMIPHHLAAIEMSENLLRYPVCRQLQSIAENIITMQTAGIENMRSVLDNCCKCTNCERDVWLYQHRHNIITQNMFIKMDTACSDNDISRNFIREMIPHHMGAVEMSHNTLKYEICPQLKPILEKIIVSQERGICEMRALEYNSH